MQPEEKDLSFKHLAHDLNNIFTRILTSIELLKRKKLSAENYALLLNNIEAGTYLASEIIESSIGNASKPHKARRININSIIQDVVRSFQFQNSGRITFYLSLEPNLKLIKATYIDVYRIVMNIITNAVESIESEGKITVSTKQLKESDNAQIEISDNGCGIEPKLIEQIFEEKFSTKETGKNSGFGLSIVKQLIEYHGGAISVKSKQQIGTTFTINFPTASANKRNLKTEKTILIAEDEDLLRGLLSELLQTYNYKILTASNGKEVLNLLNSNKCDLLILDRKMPLMDGIECISEIRKNQINVPIILASGSQTDNTEILSSLKIDHTLSKPYNFEEMLSIVEELIQ